MKTCKECRFWTKQTIEGDTVTICNQLQAWRAIGYPHNSVLEEVKKDSNYDGRLITPSDFGCNRFKPL